MKKARTYIKRLHVDLGGFSADFEDSENVDKDIRKTIETGTLQEEFSLRLLDMRPYGNS